MFYAPARGMAEARDRAPLGQGCAAGGVGARRALDLRAVAPPFGRRGAGAIRRRRPVVSKLVGSLLFTGVVFVPAVDLLAKCSKGARASASRCNRTTRRARPSFTRAAAAALAPAFAPWRAPAASRPPSRRDAAQPRTTHAAGGGFAGRAGPGGRAVLQESLSSRCCCRSSRCGCWSPCGRRSASRGGARCWRCPPAP